MPAGRRQGLGQAWKACDPRESAQRHADASSAKPGARRPPAPRSVGSAAIAAAPRLLPADKSVTASAAGPSRRAVRVCACSALPGPAAVLYFRPRSQPALVPARVHAHALSSSARTPLITADHPFVCCELFCPSAHSRLSLISIASPSIALHCSTAQRSGPPVLRDIRVILVTLSLSRRLDARRLRPRTTQRCASRICASTTPPAPIALYPLLP